MAKKPKKPDIATYFLAKQSGLFRPGQALILASTLPNARPVAKPKSVVRKEGQKYSKWRGGGQSSGGLPADVPVSDGALLLETGDFLLLETGDKLLLE